MHAGTIREPASPPGPILLERNGEEEEGEVGGEAVQVSSPPGLELADQSGAQWQFLDFLHTMRGAVNVLPPRESLPHEERVATAAVCIIRALQHQPPVHCPAGRLKAFVLLHNAYYRTLFKLAVLFHVVLAFFEPPPHLYGATSRELEDAGFFAHWKTIVANVVIVLFYNLHFAMTLWVEGWAYVQRSAEFFLAVVVLLVNVDVVVGIATGGIHPFRFLRPLVFTFTSVQQTMMLKCSMYTLKPLVKTFVLLLISIGFYSVVGLNMFGGQAADDSDTSADANAFGAACLLSAGEIHPFDNFAYSFVTMYVLATTDSNPEVMWPFYTCKCEFVSDDGNTTVVWETEDHCSSRKYVSAAFFVSFMAIVFFCLGNTILAVCYFWFERVMKRSVVVAGLQQRFSLISAFYYLETDGAIGIDDFVACSQFMRKEARGLPGTVEGDKLLFRYLDRDGDGSLNLPEFFQIAELMHTHIKLRKHQNRYSWYGRWKESSFRSFLRSVTLANVRGITFIDIVMTLIVLANGVLAALESTRKSTQRDFAEITTWVFVLEVLVKVGAMGVKGYLLDFWNRFDLGVTIAAVLGFLLDRIVTNSAFFGLVQCVRLIRLVKVFALLQRAGRDTRAEAEKKDGFYAQLLNSLATTVPVCLNVMLLVFFFLYGLSILAMELFHGIESNSQQVGLDGGTIDYAFGNQFQYDWADLDSSLLSMYVIIVGNDWADIMYNAQAANDSYWVFVFFVLVHFVGSFLLLNIIQSLFVFTFSTLMSTQDFRSTMASQVREQLDKLHRLSEESFKQVRNPPKLEFLLLNHSDLDAEYRAWLKARKKGGDIDLGTARLEVDALSSFLFHKDSRPIAPGKKAKGKAKGKRMRRKSEEDHMLRKTSSILHNERMQGFIWDEFGAVPVAAPPTPGLPFASFTNRPKSQNLDDQHKSQDVQELARKAMMLRESSKGSANNEVNKTGSLSVPMKEYELEPRRDVQRDVQRDSRGNSERSASVGDEGNEAHSQGKKGHRHGSKRHSKRHKKKRDKGGEEKNDENEGEGEGEGEERGD